MAQLFTIKIPAHGDYPSGTLLLTEPAPACYLLTLTSAPDNRLTLPVCLALLEALNILEARYPIGVVILTSGIPKFFCNGLDFQHVITIGRDYWTRGLYRLWARFASYPMPIVALINGHAFAGGLITVMFCDYRVMNPSRGFLCLNELNFGVPLKPPMSAIFRIKLPATVYRTLLLEAKQIPGSEALGLGIVDVLGGLNEALELVGSRRLTEKGRSGIYGLVKMEMYREVLPMLSEQGWDKEEEREKKIMAKLEKDYSSRGLVAPKTKL